MASRLSSGRRIVPLLCLLPLLLTGCVPIAYVYPSIDIVPPVPVGAPPDEVRAFRVEVARENLPLRSPWWSCTLKEVGVSPTGRVPVQAQVALDSGRFKPSGMVTSLELWGWSRTRNGVEVRLYRPEYQTVRLRSWRWTEAIPWQAAATLEDQEKAVDQLLFGCDAPHHLAKTTFKDFMCFDWDGSDAVLARGSCSPAHREALLFAAGEYERLAALAPENGQRTELTLKAQQLRKLADE